MFSETEFDRFWDELEYTYENVPFYKGHLESSGLVLADIQTVDDIKKIPYTQKKDYRKNFPKGVIAKGYSLRDSGLVRSQSSGTTGERLITFEEGMLLLARAVDCTSVNQRVENAFTMSPRKICRYAAPNCSDVECANPNSTTQDRLLSDGTLVLPVYHDLLTTSEELVARAIDEICTYEPDLYYVDPTHFAFLLRNAKKLNVKLPNAPIVATYTATNALNRRQITQAFSEFGYKDINYSELVSSSEMGWIGMECEEGNLHLNTESFYFEIIRDGRNAEIGEAGELFISSLDNGAIPHIRYKTGDSLTYLGSSCRCGHLSPIVRMEGRISNFISLQNGTFVSPKAISEHIGTPNWLDLYQLNQHKDFSFTLLLMVNDVYKKNSEQSLIARLEDALGCDGMIKYELVPYIATERSGKFQCVKSEIPVLDVK